MAQELVDDSAVNWSGFTVLTLVGGLAVYDEVGLPMVWSWPAFGIAFLCLVYIASFILFCSTRLRERRYRVWLVWLDAVFILALYFLVSMSAIAIFSIVWIVQAAEVYGSRRAGWMLLVAMAFFVLAQIYHWGGADLFGVLIDAVIMGMFHVFALAAISRAHREATLRAESAALNRELLATRGLLQQSSRQAERLRIARDLHDLLGHHMTALILNLEVAKHHNRGEALEKVEQSLALGKLLLSDLRTAVSDLREDDSIDLEESVRKLVAELPGIEVRLDFSAAPRIKEIQTAETLLRCIQEGVTNVLRHSSADRCDISLREGSDGIEMLIQDNGSGNSRPVPGNGLTGMQERISELAGSVNWQIGHEGFSLRVNLPGSSA